ncbi:phosphatase PAP2 family protein [Thiotrichales bacterium 19S3-7]|nr:phosphatase PAP2 family protein [Thiotrichales bacterium 19S3-7]MCF6802377.1 phosphatase PAP2 family protein [Thiotrichales bacterium 19S3-11]
MAKTSMPLKSSIICLILLGIVYWLSYYYFDQSIAYFFHDNVPITSWLYHYSKLIDNILSPNHWALIMVIIFIYCAWLYCGNQPKEKKLPWLIAALSIFLALAIGAILKYTLARYRPDMLFNHNLYGFHLFSTKHSLNSTPSGHALANFAGLISLAYTTRKSSLMTAAILLAILVCLTRLIVCEHYLSDIIFGAYIGIFSFLWVKWLILSLAKLK